MAEKGLISKNIMQAIADAIRGKNGETAQMLPVEMAAAIEAISTGTAFTDSVKAAFIQEIVRTEDKTSRELTFTHNLGEIPDIVILFRSSSGTPVANEAVFAINCPSLMANPTQTTELLAYNASYNSRLTNVTVNVSSTYNYATYFNATKTTIGAFSPSAKLVSGNKYTCLVIKLAD